VHDINLILSYYIYSNQHLSGNKKGEKFSFDDVIESIEVRRKKDRRNMIIDVTLIISFLVLVSTSTTLFNYFKCHTFYEAQGGKESYLYLDYSISCLSPRYQGYIAYAVIMIGVYPIGSNFIVPHIHSCSLPLFISNSYILFTTHICIYD